MEKKAVLSQNGYILIRPVTFGVVVVPVAWVEYQIWAAAKAAWAATSSIGPAIGGVLKGWVY